MKQIINAKPKQRLLLNELEQKVRNARNSNDYILINFGIKHYYIKISFEKDQTYTIGHNIWNMEFFIKTNIMINQYPKINNNKIASYLFDWVNKLNR